MSSSIVFHLPRSLWHCYLENFVWDAVTPQALPQHVHTFLEQAQQGHHPHLLLTGGPGIGKSHLGVGIYRWMVAQVGTVQAVWVSVANFCDRVKASYSLGYDPFESYAEATRLVVLDDLFSREWTAHERDQIIVRLIELAYQNQAAMVITMNPPPEELQVRLHAHEVSRLLEQHTVIRMNAGGKDWRRGVP